MVTNMRLLRQAKQHSEMIKLEKHKRMAALARQPTEKNGENL